MAYGFIPTKKRIVFLGDSITDDGTYIAQMNHHFRRYMPEADLEMINLGVGSETASGLSEPDHPFPRPCIHDRLDRLLELSQPEWVVACYGMNDAIFHPFSTERFLAYKEGILTLIRKIRAAGAKAIILTPPPYDSESAQAQPVNPQPEGMTHYSYMTPFKCYSSVLAQYGEWILNEGSEHADLVIDLHGPLSDHIRTKRENDPGFAYGDGIHPDAEGHWIIAKTIMGELFHLVLERAPAYWSNPHEASLYRILSREQEILHAAWKEHVGHSNPGKAIALPLCEAQRKAMAVRDQFKMNLSMPVQKEGDMTSDWKGYRRHDFLFKGREALLIEPECSAPGNPWAWRAEFFNAFPMADMALLEKGWALVYYRISDLFGCPESIGMMNEFHLFMQSEFSLAAKTVLFGFSRGGLYAFNYAAAYPSHVSVLYLDAPVLDIRSWPGGKGKGTGSPREWAKCLKIYNLDEQSACDFQDNPLDKSVTVAEAGIPVILVAGDADEGVPYDENGALLCASYALHGGTMKTIIKPGIGHHPHSLENPRDIVDFILEHDSGFDARFCEYL